MQNQKGNIGVIVSFIIVIGLVVLTVVYLSNKPEKANPLDGIKGVENTASIDTSNQEINNEEQLPTQENTMNPNIKVLNDFTPIQKISKLERIDLISGTGAEVKIGATVSVHYTGAVASTGAIFQSSKDFGPNPVSFPLANVIKGWTDGIPGMKIGGTRRLLIPSEQAYGATPPPGSGIPANADLVFDVELLEIK